MRLEALMVLRSRAYLTSGGGKPPGGALFLLSGLSPALLCAVFSQARGHPGWLPSSQAALTPRKGAEPQLLPGGPKQSAASPSKLPTCGQRQGRGVGLLAMEIQGPACLDLGLSRDPLLEQLPLSSHPCVQRGAPGTGTQPLNVRVVTAEAGIRAAKLRTAPREK